VQYVKGKKKYRTLEGGNPPPPTFQLDNWYATLAASPDYPKLLILIVAQQLLLVVTQSRFTVPTEIECRNERYKLRSLDTNRPNAMFPRPTTCFCSWCSLWPHPWFGFVTQRQYTTSLTSVPASIMNHHVMIHDFMIHTIFLRLTDTCVLRPLPAGRRSSAPPMHLSYLYCSM